jgi:hypothetical protein
MMMGRCYWENYQYCAENKNTSASCNNSLNRGACVNTYVKGKGNICRFSYDKPRNSFNCTDTIISEPEKNAKCYDYAGVN